MADQHHDQGLVVSFNDEQDGAVLSKESSQSEGTMHYYSSENLPERKERFNQGGSSLEKNLCKSEKSVYFSSEELAEEEEINSLAASYMNLQDVDDITNMTTLIPDFVLVYDVKETKDTVRKNYEEQLKQSGLILREDVPEIDETHKQIYVYASTETLYQQAELMKLRKNIKEDKYCSVAPRETDVLEKIKQFFTIALPWNIKVDEKKFPKRNEQGLTAEFSSKRKDLFQIDPDASWEDKRNFFTQSERSMMVHFVLQLEAYGDNASEHMSLKKLISEKIYSDAYPLHDYKAKEDFLQEWGSFKKFHKNQPLDYIKDYFGVKFALYFAWLGFYTDMLIPMSIFGIITLVLGWNILDNDSLSRDICDEKMNKIMCPTCDKYCDYWNLTDSCLYSQISTTFDNIWTIIFAIFMSVWTSLYLSLWKSSSAKLVHRWGLTGLRAEKFTPRPEYLVKLKKLKDKHKIPEENTKQCKVTERMEPRIPWTVKSPIIFFSTVCALFWICILAAVLTAILVFRVSSITSEVVVESDSNLEEYRTLIVPSLAALFDLCFILILNEAYNWVALKLTKRELLRTQSEFDNSLVMKIYTFQFINYYAAFFYIAFIKGRLVGNPSNYKRVFSYRLEECSPGGCLMELCIQLAVVMIGDQLFGQFQEYLFPVIWKRSTKCTKKTKGNPTSVNNNNEAPDLSEIKVDKCPELSQNNNEYGQVSTIGNGNIDEHEIRNAEQNVNEININAEQVLQDKDLENAQTIELQQIAQNDNTEETNLIEDRSNIQNEQGAEYRSKTSSEPTTKLRVSNIYGNIYQNKDHELLEWDSKGLFDEYLEMVVQYGFVTLFVTAFPLAPLCALINNLVEIRGDAKKFLKNYRRPVAQTVKNIGVWLKIMDLIGKLAILSNAFIIAFTSNFIPRLVFKYFYENEENSSYLMWSLSEFDVNDFEEGSKPMMASNVTKCHYSAFRNPPSHPRKYEISGLFWKVLAARIIFVMVYQYTIVICKLLVKWFVPAVPRNLKTQIMKEQWNLCRIITSTDKKNNLKAWSSRDNILQSRSNSRENLLSGNASNVNRKNAATDQNTAKNLPSTSTGK